MPSAASTSYDLPAPRLPIASVTCVVSGRRGAARTCTCPAQTRVKHHQRRPVCRDADPSQASALVGASLGETESLHVAPPHRSPTTPDDTPRRWPCLSSMGRPDAGPPRVEPRASRACGGPRRAPTPITHAAHKPAIPHVHGSAGGKRGSRQRGGAPSIALPARSLSPGGHGSCTRSSTLLLGSIHDRGVCSPRRRHPVMTPHPRFHRAASSPNRKRRSTTHRGRPCAWPDRTKPWW